MALGARVRQRRKEFKLTQLELAQLIGVTQSTIQSLENRDSKKSDHETLIAKVLGVTVDWLRTGSPPKFANPPTDGQSAHAADTTHTPRQRAIIEKILTLSDRMLDQLEPMIDNTCRLQALEELQREQRRTNGD